MKCRKMAMSFLALTRFLHDAQGQASSQTSRVTHLTTDIEEGVFMNWRRYHHRKAVCVSKQSEGPKEGDQAQKHVEHCDLCMRLIYGMSYR
ncbi:uncharacterized protein EI90DRAFT_3062970 [Cantharellus anzutake]|uniref:uncharacterized protein n=1 Tax=Cantharellus anzutake TaxID=1750568 RepID=UPI00190336D9|nr:uncharacterized protein EI90DRAFT_3062970 [Cantharellus anzutake]KAF8329550.1 hypothetical protein EI90DRAFT_3062970 [Cantharellus anzutake]